MRGAPLSDWKRKRSDAPLNTSDVAALYRVVLGHLGAETGRLFVISDVPGGWELLGIDRAATRIEGADIDQLRVATHCRHLAIATTSSFYLWMALLLQRRNSIFVKEGLHWRTNKPKDPAVFGNRRMFACDKNKCALYS